MSNTTGVIVDIERPVNRSQCWYWTPGQQESVLILNARSTGVIVDIDRPVNHEGHIGAKHESLLTRKKSDSRFTLHTP